MLAVFQAMSLISSREQSSSYQYMPDVNPQWSRIQRIQATISPDGLRINFGTLRPIPKALLSSKAYIKWTYEIRRQELGVDQNFVTFNQAAMFMKPYSMLANSTTKSKLSLNGYGVTNYNSRYWNQYLARMFATEEQLGGYFSTSGGGFPRNDGAMNDLFYNLNQAAVDGIQRTDPVIDESQNLAWNHWKTGQFPAAAATAQFSLIDYVDIGPFNPFYDHKDGLPDRAWYKHMSNTIPYVHSLELDYELDKIAANSLVFPASTRRTGGAGNDVTCLDNGVLSAELVLTWIVPHEELVLPKEISIPSWTIDVKSFPVNGGAALQDVFEVGATTTIDTEIIHYHQVPTYLLIFAARDKDDANYLCRAHAAADDTGGTNRTFFNDDNSYESNLRMTNMRVTTNVNNRYIDANWSEEELYALAASNCKEMPQSFSAYIGGNAQYSNQPCQAFTIFKPDDLSIKQSPGKLRRDFTLRVQSDMRTSTGFHIQQNQVASYVYRFFVISIYAQDFLTFGRDRKVEKRLLTQFV